MFVSDYMDRLLSSGLDHTFLPLLIAVITVNNFAHADYSFPDYRDHPCLRECTETDAPRVCEYNFTIEWYFTMTVHCGDCPFNTSHCDRPNCVPAEGTPRAILTVNRQLPGPAIQVCEGDTILVNVFSHPDMSEGVTIHWHGLHQKGSQFNDGAEMITQCPITPFARYQYRFVADTPGTHFWHSHAGLQRADGLFGALIIRQPRKKDIVSVDYDHDLPQHVIVTNDWFVNPTINRYAAHTHGGEKLVKTKSLLINGHGVYRSYENNNTGKKTFTPRATFEVSQGQSYRFRLIHNGVSACPILISISNHTLLVVTSDGIPFEPQAVDAVLLSAGERYDFILVANQSVDNYWLKVEEIADCGEGERPKIPTQLSILRYENATTRDPKHSPANVTTGKWLNSWNAELTKNRMPVTSLKTSVSVESGLDGVPDQKFYLALDTRLLDDLHVSQPELHPVYAYERREVFYAPQINKITLMSPPSPLLYQSKDVPEELFCDSASVSVNCSKEYCICVHRLRVGLGDLVELVVVDEGTFLNVNHPMHLHGYHFRILGLKQLNVTTTLDEVKRLDKAGLIERNFVDPVLKDTVLVPDGGYAVLRFFANNPGFWLFHCHVQFHAQTSMGVVIQVGDRADLPPKPKHFPTCGNWQFEGFDDDEEPGCNTGGTAHQETNLLLVLLVGVRITSLFFKFTTKDIYATDI